MQALKGDIALKNAIIAILIAENLEYYKRCISAAPNIGLTGYNINSYTPILLYILKKLIPVSIAAINCIAYT